MAAHALRSFRRILVPVSDTASVEEAMAVACHLAPDRHAVVELLAAIEVPAELPLDAQMADEEDACRRALANALSIAELYGVSTHARVVRARSAGEAIVDAARAQRAELVVIGSPRRAPRTRRSRIFGSTVGHVLANSPCRVMVTATSPPR